MRKKMPQSPVPWYLTQGALIGRVAHCPFCNRKQPVKLNEINYCESATGFSVLCRSCGAMGPDCKTKREARYRWNCWRKIVGERITELEGFMQWAMGIDNNLWDQLPKEVRSEWLRLVRGQPKKRVAQKR